MQPKLASNCDDLQLCTNTAGLLELLRNADSTPTHLANKYWVLPMCKGGKVNSEKTGLSWWRWPQAGREGVGLSLFPVPYLSAVLASVIFFSFHWYVLKLWLIIESSLKFHSPALSSSALLSKLSSQIATDGLFLLQDERFGSLKKMLFISQTYPNSGK